MQVKGAASVTINVRRSVVGPVITDHAVDNTLGADRKAHHTLALLWVSTEPSVSTGLCVYRHMGELGTASGVDRVGSTHLQFL